MSDMTAAVEKAWKIDPADKTVNTYPNLDAKVATDGSKTVLTLGKSFSRKNTFITYAYRIYLLDAASAQPKLLADHTAKDTRSNAGGSSALAPDSKSIAYADRNFIFVDALDGTPARHRVQD